ncbi:TIM barrel protein [Verrucomicrobiaceae bacterium 227]
MNRRHFSQLTASVAALAGGSALANHHEEKGKAFLAKFGPHPGLLPVGPGRNDDYIAQLQFAYDLGYRGWEDNGFNGQPAAVQEKVGAFMKEKKMAFGVSVITTGAKAMFHKPTADQLESIKKDLRRGVEVAKRSGQTFMTMLPGLWDEESMTREEQIAASVDTMKICCDIVEEHGIVLAQEPLSHGIGGGQPLIRSFEDGHLLCKLVNRKSCKLLADFFHEGQIGNGDKLVENAEKVWDQVCYIQYGDSPGRKEPGTGKLDMGAVTKFLRKKKYEGVIGMEHGASKGGQEGLDALMTAYRKIDA